MLSLLLDARQTEPRSRKHLRANAGDAARDVNVHGTVSEFLKPQGSLIETHQGRRTLSVRCDAGAADEGARSYAVCENELIAAL